MKKGFLSGVLSAQLEKVCKFFGAKKRQITASILCAAMILTMLPVMSLTSSAGINIVPLTFTAEANNSSVTFNYDEGSNVMYKTSGSTWAAYTKGTSVTLQNIGDTVSFRGKDVITSWMSHFSMTGKIAASGDVTSLLNEVGGDVALTAASFGSLFENCTSLTTSPGLPSTTLYNYCYQTMFSGCSNLTTVPELPATAVASGCYKEMFMDCTSITAAPELPAKIMADSCYQDMFKGCTSLKTAPELPANTLAQGCYYRMFYECESLTAAPELPATEIADYCYSYMFYGCTSLIAPPELPVTEVRDACFTYMFYGCTNIKVSATKIGNYTKEWRIPTTGTLETTANSWNSSMLNNTGGTFTQAPALNTIYYIYVEPIPLTFTAETGDSSVTFDYDSAENVMFKKGSDDWVAYTKGTPINLNINETVSFKGINTKTIESAHFSMTGKIAASGDVTSLANGVGGDVALTPYCYNYMFDGCTSLTKAPALPTTTTPIACYAYMFQGCTGLTTAPELPATTLANYCYNYMFQGCTSLKTAPELRATTLAGYCYNRMFQGCTSLEAPPELPATTLGNYCYSNIFADCTSLKISATKVGCYTKEWSVPTTGTATETSGWNDAMLSGTGGTFTENPQLSTIYYVYEVNPLTFTAETDESSVTLNYVSGSNVKYKLNNAEWADYTKGTSIQLSQNDTLSFKGNDIKTDLSNHFSMTGRIAASGDVTSLTNEVGGDVTLTSSCYAGMFKGCTSLTSAPALPSTTLAWGCYSNMFFACTSLTTAPVLPATTLCNNCYMFMFYGCTNLETAPELNATTLADSCYEFMFSGCTSLEAAPELPATELRDSCYNSMFIGCTSLTTVPELPATNLPSNCYSSMFLNCSSLKISETETGDYTKAWRIPTTGTGTGTGIETTGFEWNGNMFNGTGGTFKGSPLLNNTYYIHVDRTPPAVSGIENGRTYCETAEFIVTEEEGLDTVTVNENPLTALDGMYTLTASGTNTVVVTDKAGNSTTVTVTINASHTYDNDCDTSCNVCNETRTITHNYNTQWSSDGTYHWRECSVCGDKKDYGTHELSSEDNDCSTPVTCKICNVIITAAQTHDFNGVFNGYDDNYHWHICSNDGCNQIDEKQAHGGGIASYDHKAVCTACNHEYGSTIPDTTAPTGEITISTDSWTEFSSEVSYELFLLEVPTVTVKAADTESGVFKIEYLLSGTVFESEDTVTGTWTDITDTKQFDLSLKSKQYIYVRLTDVAGNTAIINSDGVVVYSDSSISPAAATFDKNYEKQANIAITITLNGNTLKGIKNGTSTLILDTDYTVSGNTVTIKKEYLAALEKGNVKLDFSFYPMGVEDEYQLSIYTATITVDDTTHYHDIKHIVAVEPTCTSDGNAEYWTCSGCQTYFGDKDGSTAIALADTVKTKLGHDMVHTDAVEATCTTDGNIEYWHCTRCDKYFSDKDGITEITLAKTAVKALGHDFKNYVSNNDATYEKDGTETAKCERCQVTDTRTAEGTKLIDTTAPTGEIKIGDNSFKSFVNSITFGLFFKESKTITVTGEDKGIGLDKVYYLTSETALDNDAVKALAADKWTEGTSFTVSPDWKGVIYAKITDKSGNTSYISSDGLVFDATSPVLTGIKDNGKYCGNVTVTVTETYITSVKLNGTAALLLNGELVVSAKDGAQTIIVTDKAGNETTVTITVYTAHIWDAGKVTTDPTTTTKGVKTYTCTLCGETKTEDVAMLAPSITDGKDATYKKGGTTGLTFKSNAALADFISVSVDGTLLDYTNYSTSEGSTVVTLTTAYLDTLSVGKHTLSVKSTSGTASTEFTIAAKDAGQSSPPTGDTSNTAVWIALVVIFGGVLTTMSVTKKRKTVNIK